MVPHNRTSTKGPWIQCKGTYNVKAQSIIITRHIYEREGEHYKFIIYACTSTTGLRLHKPDIFVQYLTNDGGGGGGGESFGPYITGLVQW